jgi:apolipoprotein N-acyltransferase
VKLIAGLLLSLLSGLSMGYLTYDLHLPLLALVAWAPGVVAQHVLWPSRWRGAAMGLTWFAYLAVAFAPKLAPELGGWAWLLPPGIGLLVLFLDQATVQKAQQTGYRLFWWQQAFAVTAIEVGRSFIPAVATWTMAGYSLTAAPGWLTVASWIGLTGLSLAVWSCNFALAYILLTLLKAAPWRPVAGSLAVIVTAACLLIALLPVRPTPATPTLRVAALQVGFDLYQAPWSERREHGDQVELSRDLLAHGVSLTREAAAQGARLVVWPEGFLRIVPQEHPEFKGALEELARETGATLAVGYVIETPAGRRNEVALITPSGEWAVTAKDHPVPWAETGSATRGQVATVAVDGQRIGAIICYDADFTDTVRERAGTGLNLLVALAHDWPAIGGARAVHVRTRAAENRLPVVMADWQVGSVVVDGGGQFLAELPHDAPSRGLLVADVPMGNGRVTPYGRLGDLAGWASVGGMVLATVLEGLLLRRRQRASAMAA